MATIRLDRPDKHVILAAKKGAFFARGVEVTDREAAMIRRICADFEVLQGWMQRAYEEANVRGRGRKIDIPKELKVHDKEKQEENASKEGGPTKRVRDGSGKHAPASGG